MIEHAFLRAIVIDVIVDPTTYKISSQGKSLLEEILNNSGIRDVNNLPRNTIIAKLAKTDYNSNLPHNEQIFFPFFSSHLCLPVKPKEHVWVMYESHSSVTPDFQSRKGFWLSRIHEARSIEDANYTHSEREFNTTQIAKTLTAAQKAGVKPKRDSLVAEYNSGASEATNSGGLEDTTGHGYLGIALNSDAERLIKYEAVPRFTKSPGDLVIQGSNNTLISLGNARADRISTESVSSANSLFSKLDTGSGRSSSGEIDIVVGRGNSVRTSPSIKSTEWNTSETDKTITSNENPVEGDPDYLNDRARVLVSTLRDPDSLFDINFTTDNPGVFESALNKVDETKNVKESANTPALDVSCVAASADTIRLVARQNIKIVGNNPNESWGITITTEGDIIIIPAKEGLIKLGGSDADRALVCSAIPAKTELQNGVLSVQEHPIQTDGNSIISPVSRNPAREGAGSKVEDQGAFASRILVKGN